jgi:beta-glucosidase
MINHGFCKDKKECARKSISAGLDMEMVSTCYAEHLETLVKEGGVTAALIDSAVSNILRIKFRLGLFESSMTDPSLSKDVVRPEDRLLSRELAL